MTEPSSAGAPWWQPHLRRLQGCSTENNSSWPPYLWLLYLGFLFVPATWHDVDVSWLWATLISLPLFFVLYLHYLARRPRATVGLVLLIAALCFAVEPFNPFANTYLVFAAALAPHAFAGLVRPLVLVAGLLALHTLEVLLLGQPLEVIIISVIICVCMCMGNAYGRERRERDAALRLSQEEVRRLAVVAERERIGRDLHDLLGHTLSLVAIKGELAGKLVSRDPHSAEREIGEVTQIARDALRQVRTAVTGMRAAALGAELLSARVLLESSGVALTCHQDEAVLPPPVETALALIVREAATNIQRHSGASAASVEIRNEASQSRQAVALRVSDNGRGGVARRGNGLTGIGERVRALGGTLEIDSAPGGGTVLRAVLPVSP